MVEKYSDRKLYMPCTVSYTYTTNTRSLNRPVTLPPELYKVRQGPFSLITHHLVITSNQSRATQHIGCRVLHTSRP
jgi:hypothetical protein